MIGCIIVLVALGMLLLAGPVLTRREDRRVARVIQHAARCARVVKRARL